MVATCPLLAVLLITTCIVATFGRALPEPGLQLQGQQGTGGTTKLFNDRPIIGVLTLPGGEVSKDLSYISASYVKWLEAAGARVVPIMYDLSHTEAQRMFKIFNGLLIPGGNYPLKPTTHWYKTAKLLFDLAVEANDKGDHFPIHGTCLGLQLLVTLVCGDEYATSSVDAHDHPSQLIWTGQAATSPFLSTLPSSVRNNLASKNISMHNHYYGLLPDAMEKYPELRDFFQVQAFTQDRQGVRYVSILEAKKYPFTGLAFHPEKVPYEWTTSVSIPHSREALDASYFLAQGFVDQARLSQHSGINIVEEDHYLIYNWAPKFSGKHYKPEEEAFFEQVYVFRQGARYDDATVEAMSIQELQALV